MTYAELITKFMAKIDQIFRSNPKRREPGDGSDGYCDCIGLIIGAIRRLGYKWNGIHGSNYAARYETVNLKPITSQGELKVGDIVYKSVPKGHRNWALPSRYFKGNRYYNGDLNDYYHVGVVASVNPFQIRHMSSRMTTDTKVNTYYPWTYYGQSRILVNASKDTPAPEPKPDPTIKKAIVVAQKGGTVNMRSGPSKKNRVMIRIRLGETVTIVEPGEEWARITYNKFTGYMMAEFLDIIGDGKGKY